jgi:signal transduction histidine kinase
MAFESFDLQRRVQPLATEDSALATFDPHRPHQPPRRVRRARAALVGLLIGAISLVTWLTFRRVNEQLRQGIGEKLEAILQANVGATQVWLEGQDLMVRALASSPAVSVEAAVAINGEGQARDDARQALNARFQPLRIAGVIVDYLVVTPGRTVAASSIPAVEGVTLAATPPWETLRTRGSVVSAPFLRQALPEGTQSTSFIAAAPIGPQGDPLGFLILALDGGPLVKRLHMAQWGNSGETYAFDSRGLMMSESRFTHELKEKGLLPPSQSSSIHFRLVDPGPRDTPSIERDASNLPLSFMAREATSGRSGENLTGYHNYLGTRVVGAWTWLPEYNFGLATEVSEHDALESVALLRRASIVLASLVVLALVGFALLSRWTMKLRERSVLVSQRLDRLSRAIQPLSAALENEPGAVLLVNNHLEVVYANPAAVTMVGTSQPLAGTALGTVFQHLSPELRSALIEGQDTVVSQGSDDEGETVLVSTRQLYIDGKPHALCTLRPVTHELRRREVEHWKKLIRVMSHELNNSLAPITSLVSSARKLVEMGADKERLGKIFDTISERTDHLLAFLESYRSVARLPRPTKRETDWQSFIDGLSSQSQFRLLGEVPETMGFFDPIQLERVFVNLLKNAREAGGRPEDIALRVTSDEKGVRLEVLDRGSGMNPRVLEQAMLPFYSTKRTGTGVGLALAREIVEAHHGRITLANREGGGLCVAVWIPHKAEHLLSTSL